MNRRTAIPLTAALLLLVGGATPAMAGRDPLVLPPAEQALRDSLDGPSGIYVGHPLVGSWLVDPQPDDPGNPLAIDTFAADGTIRHAGGAAGAGAWVPTGERSAHMTLIWVEANEDGGWGTVTIKGTIEVSQDGLTWSGGEQTIEFSDGMAETFGTPLGEFGPMPQASARRITVELMNPSGPMPGPSSA